MAIPMAAQSDILMVAHLASMTAVLSVTTMADPTETSMDWTLDIPLAFPMVASTASLSADR